MQVSTNEVPNPKDSNLPLNAHMLHNLAHVELNAIDLAWDTVARFSPFLHVLGYDFFDDFAHVADDESRHFLWCSQRLAELGFKSVSFILFIGIGIKNQFLCLCLLLQGMEIYLLIICS